MILKKFKIHGFTIMEIVISVMVVGIVAAMAIPGYNKSRDLAIEKDMVENLKIIRTAYVAYLSRTDPSPMVDPPDIYAINAKLNLNIIPNEISYILVNSTSPWSITAVTAGGMSISVDETTVDPYCVNPGSCPSLGP